MAGSYEVGAGHFAVLPTFKGFRKSIDREAAAAGKSGASGFSKAMGRGGDVAGGLAGRGFAKGFSRSSSVSSAMAVVQKEVRAAAANVSKMRLSEADAAGKVRVAEAGLADARARFSADSVQVIRAEERLASVRRAHTTAAESLRGASERLTHAQQVLASATSGASARGGFFAQLSKDVQPLRGHLAAATGQLGAFYRTSAAMAPVRKMVDGISTAWTRTGNVLGGLGPVVLRPLGRSFADVATKAASGFKTAALSVPGVSRAVSALSGPLGRAGSLFGALGTAGVSMGRTIMSVVGPVGGQVASMLGKGFSQAASMAGQSAAAIGRSFQGVLGGAVAGAVVGLLGSLKGGFDRLASVETATAKMRGFGLEAGTVTDVMAQVKDSVQGTVYSVGEMGNAAASAVLAGVKPGQQLEKYMSLVKNTATAAGAPLNEIQSIFGKIAANVGGPVTTELNQLTDRGIPAWTILSEKMGLSVTELKNMASEGKITSDVIVEHLGGAMENMAEEVGGTTVSALQRMKTSFSRFGEALMTESFPGVKAVADAVRSVMDAAIALMGPIKEAFGLNEVGPAIDKINGFTERVQAFTEMIKSGSGEGKSALGGIIEKVREFAPILGLAAAAALPLMGGFLSGLPIIGGLFSGLGSGLLAGLAPIIAGGGLIAMLAMDPAQFSGMIEGLMSSVVSGLGSIVESVTSVLSTLVPAMVTNLTANAPALAAGFVTLLTGLAGAVGEIIPVVVDAVVQMIPAIVTALTVAIPALIEGGIALLLGLVQGVVAAIPVLVEAVVAAIPELVTAIVGAIPLLMEGALQLFLGLIQGLITALPQIITAVVEAIPVIIAALVEQIPAFVEGAITLFLGLIEGLTTAIPQILEAVIGAIPQIVSAIAGAVPVLIPGAIQLFLGLVTGLVQAIPQILSAVVGMIPQIVGAIIDAIPQLLQAGIDLIGGLVQGIGDSASMVMDAIGGVVTGAIDWAKGLLGIKSPSRVFMQIGDFVGQGLSKGLEGTKKRVQSAAASLVDVTRDAFKSLEADEFRLPVAADSFAATGSAARRSVLSLSSARGCADGRSIVVQAPVEVKVLERDPDRIGRAIGRSLEVALGGI